MRLKRGAAALLTLSMVTAMAACASGGNDKQAPDTAVEVISWWTSESEKSALNVLFDRYRQANPGKTVLDGTVSGGSGSNAQVVLASRLQRNDPPDAWQSFPGAALQANVARGTVSDVSSVYADSGLAANLPKPVLEAFTVNGKQYGVPTSAHRQNVLWFNKQALAGAGVPEPGAGYTLDRLLADAQTLKSKGVTPFCLGGKDGFTKVELFENVLLSVVGPEGWSQIQGDRFEWNGEQTRQALQRFGSLLDASDPDAESMTWDAASRKLATGGCAFQSMNDSSYGEYLKAGATPASMGSIPFPGTDQAYLSVIDGFVVANGAKHPDNATAFLRTLASADTQAAFSVPKGSIPVRTDASLSGLQPYQQQAAESLRTGTPLLSMTHGELVSPAFQQGLYDAVAGYAARRDPQAFGRTLTANINVGVPGGH